MLTGSLVPECRILAPTCFQSGLLSFLIIQYITSIFSVFFDPHDVASGTSIAEGGNVITQTHFPSHSIHINITHIITFCNFNKIESDSTPSLHSHFNNPTPPSDSNFPIIPISQQICDNARLHYPHLHHRRHSYPTLKPAKQPIHQPDRTVHLQRCTLRPLE